MFPFDDPTRRRVCILAFLALGVAPTLWTVGWCTLGRLAGGAQAQAKDLNRQLGLHVVLAGLEYPRPWVVRYKGLELTQPETGRAVLRCRRLDAAWTTATDAQGRSVPSLKLTASGLEIAAEGLDELARVLALVMESRTALVQPHVCLVAGDVVLHAGPSAQPLTDVHGTVEIASTGPQAQLYFRPAGENRSKLACLCIGRNRQISPPTPYFLLDTGDAPLRCSMLAPGLPDLAQLGTTSRFQGYLWAYQTPDGWQGESAGQWTNVELDGVVPKWSAHKLTGMAQVTIKLAKFSRGHLESLSGAVCAGPGSISRSLLCAAVEQLGLTHGAEPTTSSELIPYQRLAANVALDNQGLWLVGLWPAAEGPSILVAGGHRLLGDPPAQPRPAAALVQALMPAGPLQLPANRQSQRLAHLLPLPDAIPSGNARELLPKR